MAADEMLSWRGLRALADAQSADLSGPRPGLAGLCTVCHGPAGAGSRWCYQCDLHRQCAPGALADLVVPIAFAVKGGPHARRLWQYKSARPGAGPGSPEQRAAAACLLALLVVFLKDHGTCLWRASRTARPSHAAVVPSARARPGRHPLAALLAPHLMLPWADLAARPGQQPIRELDPGRFRARAIPGARVLLLDDTWTTGATAQSAAMALRRAGAESVVTVVLGRHVGRLPGSGVLPGGGVLPAPPLIAGTCAVHAGPPCPAGVAAQAGPGVVIGP